MRLNTCLAALALGTAISTPGALAGPRVIASIVPVHSLVASIMDGVGEPELLLQGLSSEHQASYAPRQIEALGSADVVFMIGHGLELKLDELSGSEAVNRRTFVALSDTPGLTKLPIRVGATFPAHVHDADEAEDGHADGTAAYDPHLWLDPENAKLMGAAIAGTLAKADPDHASQYAANATALSAEIDALEAALRRDLADVRGKPFLVQHDAYQYFERRFGLTAAGSITDFAASEPSAQRLKEVRDIVKASGAVCVFREPQFSARAADAVTEDTPARSGVVDGIGSTLVPGKQAYGTLLRTLAQSLKDCLAG